MRLFFSRGKLRLEERGYEEAVGGRLDGANLSVGSAGYDREASFHSGPFVLGIDFKVAEELLAHHLFVFSVKGLQVRAGAQANLRNHAGELGGVAFAVGNGACYGIDDDILGAGIIFGGVGIGDAEHIAGELDERVLESGASPEKRPVPSAGELDAFEHAVEAFEGTAGRGQKSVEPFEKSFGVWLGERGSWNPFGFDFQVELPGGVLQGIRRGMVGAKF